MPVVGNPYQEAPNVMGESIGQLLNLVLTMNKNRINTNQDRAYRSAAAKIMGVPEENLGYFQRDELKDLVKDKMKSSYGEWKPKTKEEAIEVAAAKKGASKSFEEEIKSNVAQGIPLDRKQTDYFNKFIKKSMDPEIIYTDPNTIAAPVNTGRNMPQGQPPENSMGNKLLQLLGGGGGISSLIQLLGRPKTGAVTSPVPTSMPQTTAQPTLTGDILRDRQTTPVTAPVTDPIAARIQESLAKGMDPKEIARMLQEKGIDPATYGL